VIYTIDNETSGSEEWGAYWADYIKQEADAAGVSAFSTEMWDAWDLRDEQHRRTLDHPDRYDFVEISQNNHQVAEKHWENLQWVRAHTSRQPRPLNNVKIYGADTERFGSDRDGLERFWRNLVGGAASVRFHRPPWGLGLSESVQGHVRSTREWTAAFDLFRAVPDSEHRRLRMREANEAYATVVPEEQISVYFPDGGAVGLDLGDMEGAVTVRWLHLASGTWQDGPTVEGGDWVPLSPPGDGHWLVVLSLRI
jgi:hypothetical protein